MNKVSGSCRLSARAIPAMRIYQSLPLVATLLLLASSALAGPPKRERKVLDKPSTKADVPPEEEADEARLVMSRAIACESVAGFADYVGRPTSGLTTDEKLLVYYEPRNFVTERIGKRRQARLVQDVRLRRRDQKAALWSKDKLVDYTAKNDGPISEIYLTNTISLKGLRPGEYDLDIILHDEIGGGRPATQTLRFSIKPPRQEMDDETEAEGPAGKRGSAEDQGVRPEPPGLTGGASTRPE